MKKVSLNIKEPCHENWEAMTQQEKGKFCGSCQKTVVDFTFMSDRQIAEFFKKPAGSVCGRFYQDQLQRPMEIPKKKNPWVRYFFQITWPAFMLFLKSCGQRENITGKIELKTPHGKTSNDMQVATLGYVMPQIMPVDTSYINQKAVTIDTTSAVVAIAKVEPPPSLLMGDTLAMPLENTEVLKERIKEVKAMDTANIISYQTISCGRMIGGVVSVVTTKEVQSNTNEIKAKDLIEDANLTVYPNPARASAQITIASSRNTIVKQFQLFSSSGAMMKTTQANSHYGKAKFSVPASVAPGTYFLRIIVQDEKIKTTKIIITN